jgi:hypothetical protein
MLSFKKLRSIKLTPFSPMTIKLLSLAEGMFRTKRLMFELIEPHMPLSVVMRTTRVFLVASVPSLAASLETGALSNLFSVTSLLSEEKKN